jgi:hypothetical protein
LGRGRSNQQREKGWAKQGVSIGYLPRQNCVAYATNIGALEMPCQSTGGFRRSWVQRSAMTRFGLENVGNSRKRCSASTKSPCRYYLKARRIAPAAPRKVCALNLWRASMVSRGWFCLYGHAMQQAVHRLARSSSPARARTPTMAGFGLSGGRSILGEDQIVESEERGTPCPAFSAPQGSSTPP